MKYIHVKAKSTNYNYLKLDRDSKGRFIKAKGSFADLGYADLMVIESAFESEVNKRLYEISRRLGDLENKIGKKKPVQQSNIIVIGNQAYFIAAYGEAFTDGHRTARLEPLDHV